MRSLQLATTSDLYSRGVGILRCCHDSGVGLFKGMATAMVNRVNPHMAGLEAGYHANGRVVNSALIGAAATGFCYAPWWTLATVVLVVPSLYAGYRLGAPAGSATVEEVDAPATGTPIAPGLPMTNLGMLPCAASEETEIMLARLVPVFISVLQVALALRDKAGDSAASSLKVITSLEANADKHWAAQRKSSANRL